MRQQPAVLRDVADSSAKCHRVDCRDVLVVDRDGARIRIDEAIEAPQQRRLSGAAFTDDGEQRPGSYSDGDSIQGGHCAEALRNALSVQGGAFHVTYRSLPKLPVRVSVGTTTRCAAHIGCATQ